MLTLLLSLPLVVGSARPFAADDPVAAVEAYLANCERFGWSGVALVARGDAPVLHRGYGMADREAGIANGPDTVFEIASATKPFTAAAVLALVDAGKLDLDASIAEYLPSVPVARRRITVRHLLAHTSGMPRSATDGKGSDLATAVAAYLAPEPTASPGARYEYWNGGYALLAGIVERVSGVPYTDYCRKSLFERAGLAHTGFTGDDAWPAERQAVGYDGGKAVRRAAEHPYGSYGYQYLGMGGIVTSADELWRLTRAVLGGALLAEATLAEMVRPVAGSYGLGPRVATTERGARRIGHGGNVRGFQTQVQTFPDEDLAIVLLSNVMEPPISHLSSNIEALMLGGKPPYPMPPDPVALEPGELAAFAGEYVLARDGRVRVAETSGGLLVTGTSLPTVALLAGVDPDGDAIDDAEHLVGLIDALANRRKKDLPVAPHIPGDWAARLVDLIYPAHEQRFGGLLEIEPLVVARPRADLLEGWLRLRHQNGEAHVHLVLLEGRISGLDLAVAAPATATRLYVPTRPSGERGPLVFVTYEAGSAPALPVLRFEPARGTARSLVVERPTGNRTKLARAK